MRYLWLITLVAIYPIQAELSIEEIDNMVAQIQGRRQSKVEINFKKIHSPFVTIVEKKNGEEKKDILIKDTQKKDVKLNLNAIVNFQANINGLWVKEQDTIEGYKVLIVSRNWVQLGNRSMHKRIRLFLPNPSHKKNLKIIIKNKSEER